MTPYTIRQLANVLIRMGLEKKTDEAEKIVKKLKTYKKDGIILITAKDGNDLILKLINKRRDA